MNNLVPSHKESHSCATVVSYAWYIVLIKGNESVGWAINFKE